MLKMILHVCIEQHFVEYQGNVYTDIAFDYAYWREYLQVFEEVYPIARVRLVNDEPKDWKRADGDRVKFVKITDYIGFWDFLLKLPSVIIDCFKATQGNGCYLLRLGNISTFCWLWLLLKRKKYAYEAVGHAGESVLLVKNVQSFGLAKVIASCNHFLSKLQAKYAFCASYTSRYVQSLYPTKNKDNEWIFSSVKLDDKVITQPRSFGHKNTFNIISVGRIEPEKGHHILIDAIIILLKEGLNITTKIIGPGREIDNLRSVVSANNYQDKILLLGSLPWGEELFKYLDEADLFVLPSLTEGMPRALLEAMARGLPALGSDTGGIKELLDELFRAKPADSVELADKIRLLINNQKLLEEMSKKNYEKALEYREEIMQERKLSFWNFIKNNIGG
ncbi:MAG: glycosyltransferase family 4 protein [Sedimentisphaerales bacterium]